MSVFLNPRFIVGLVIVGLLSFSHFFVYRAGKNYVRLEWKASVAQANVEARKMEQRRQAGVDEAVRSARSREAGIRVDAAGNAGLLGRVRDAYAARDLAQESRDAAVKRADTAEKLLLDGGRLLAEIGERCDRHVSDLKTLTEAWPK